MEVAVVNILKVKDTGHTLLQDLAKEQVARVVGQKNQEPDWGWIIFKYSD